MTVEEESKQIKIKRFKVQIVPRTVDYLLRVGSDLLGGYHFSKKFNVSLPADLGAKQIKRFKDSVVYEIKYAIDREIFQVLVASTNNKNDSIVYDDGRLNYILIKKLLLTSSTWHKLL